MLSDEEKKAIEDFKECYEKDISRYEDFNTYTQYIFKRNELILNLIEKQSKEIEELNKSDASKEQSSMNYYNLYKELIDKIKAKIEELDYNDISNFERRCKQEVLQSLLKKE